MTTTFALTTPLSPLKAERAPYDDVMKAAKKLFLAGGKGGEPLLRGGGEAARQTSRHSKRARGMAALLELALTGEFRALQAVRDAHVIPALLALLQGSGGPAASACELPTRLLRAGAFYLLCALCCSPAGGSGSGPALLRDPAVLPALLSVALTGAVADEISPAARAKALRRKQQRKKHTSSQEDSSSEYTYDDDDDDDSANTPHDQDD
jgi:hypothetical protein